MSCPTYLEVRGVTEQEAGGGSGKKGYQYGMGWGEERGGMMGATEGEEERGVHLQGCVVTCRVGLDLCFTSQMVH